MDISIGKFRSRTHPMEIDAVRITSTLSTAGTSHKGSATGLS